ncbi:oxamate carbamoyltransferase subunit AllG family protein [Escherichia coli]
MAGVTSASMFMHIVKNKTYGNIAYTNMSEQMAKILRMGANDQKRDRPPQLDARCAGANAARRDENYR